MFTIFEARSMDTGELVSGLSITATFYDVNGSQTVLTAPVDLGGGRYAINLEESGTVVLDTPTEKIFLPILRFQYSVEQDVDSIQSSVAAMQEDLEGITSVPTAEDNASAVWSATTRTLTSDAAPSAETVASAVWAYVTGSGSSAETELTSTATSTELSAVAAGRTLADLATPSDVELTTTTETVEVVSQVVDLTELKTYGDTNWSTAAGFATPSNLDSAVSSITAHGDVNWVTATGFATPADVQLTTTTETVEVTTQTVDLTELKTYGDANWSTAAGFATPTDVSGAVSSVISHGDTNWVTATGFATPTNLDSAVSAITTHGDGNWKTATGFATPEDVQLTTTTQTVDLTELKTYGDSNWKTATGFVTSVPSTSEIATSVWSYGTSSNDRTVKAEGVQVEGVTVDFTELEAYGDLHWSTAAGFATSTELSTIAAGRTLADLATPDDVQLTTTTETVDLTDLKAYGDTNWSTAVGFSTPSDVSGAVSSITTHGDTNWKTATGFATPADVQLTTTTETVDLTELKSYGDTHWSTATGFVTSVPSTSDIATSVWSYGDSSNSRTVKAEGVQVEGVTVDFTELEAYGDLHWATATGFATPDDVQLTTTTETVEVTTQTVDLTELKTYGDSNWSTATGFATPEDVQLTTTTETVEVTTQQVDLTELKTYGDTNWKTATGFATPADVQLTTTTETVEVISQVVDLTELKTYGDTNWSTATGFATPSNVTAAVSSITSHGDTYWATATGFATPEDVTLTTTTQTVDLTELKAYGDSNWKTATGFVTSVPSTADIATSVWSYGNSSNSRTVKAEGVQVEGVTVDFTELKTYGDAHWSTATGFVTSVPTTSEIAAAIWGYDDKVVPLTDADLANVARSVLTYDLTNLDSNSVRYSADNALRLMMLASNTNNHSAAGDTYSALKTNGTVKAQFNVITNKRGEREKIS